MKPLIAFMHKIMKLFAKNQYNICYICYRTNKVFNILVLNTIIKENKSFFKEVILMTSKIKKAIASVMAVASLTMGMTGITSSAADVGKINLHKAAGAPGSATVTYQSWNFTTASSITSMSIDNYTKSGSNSYVYLYSDTGCSSNQYGTGAVSAKDVKLGISAYASASLNDFSSGTHQAIGWVRG